jgi:transposase-like protein
VLGSGNDKLTSLWAIDAEHAKRYVTRVLRATDGNVAEAARKVGMSANTLWRWVRQNPDLRAELDRIVDERRSGRGRSQ